MSNILSLFTFSNKRRVDIVRSRFQTLSDPSILKFWKYYEENTL